MSASVADALRVVLLSGALALVLFVGWSTRRSG
jgi:hypothetical protein